jgi:mannose-6-phosphate isomerase-like protein (cupin superfamily)
VKAQDGKSCHLGSTGVRFMIDGNDSSSRFSLVEHPMQPRVLAAPLHRHRNEDEYSFVIEGRIGADLGGEIVFGDRGDLIFKPRNQWHTFWNAGDEPARILEIISPAGLSVTSWSWPVASRLLIQKRFLPSQRGTMSNSISVVSRT